MSETLIKKLINPKTGESLALSYSELEDSPLSWDYAMGMKLVFGFYGVSKAIADISSSSNDIGNKIKERNTNSLDYVKDVQKWFDSHGYIAVPVYKYQHSDVIYSTTPIVGGNQFDGGITPSGIAIIEKEKYTKIMGIKTVNKKKATDVVQGLLEDYTSYCNGEVYELLYMDKNDTVAESLGSIFSDDSYEKIINDYINDFELNMNDFIEEE
jgi:hypothetical protein